jgi:hypothetical protein
MQATKSERSCSISIVLGLKKMRQAILFNLLCVFLIGTLIAQAQRANSKRVESVEDIEHFLAYEEAGGVFDFGRYLKGDGIQELQELSQTFLKEGFRLWILTIPESMPVHVAERIYGNMNYDEKDILIVFKPGRLYGKTLALKGEPEKFTEYVEKSRKAFKKKTPYGLKHYALLIKKRISERRDEAIRKKSRQVNIFWTTGIIFGLVVIGGLVGFIFLVPMRRRKIYQEKIESASTLLGEISMMEIPERLENRFLELSSRLDGFRVSENYRETDRVGGFIEDLKGFRKEIEGGRE